MSIPIDRITALLHTMRDEKQKERNKVFAQIESLQFDEKVLDAQILRLNTAITAMKALQESDLGDLSL